MGQHAMDFAGPDIAGEDRVAQGLDGLGNGGNKLEVGAGGIFGSEFENENAGGLVVESVEIDSFGFYADSTDNAVDGAGFDVRQGKPVLHAGRNNLFAFEQGVVNLVTVSLRDVVSLDKKVKQFGDDFVFSDTFEAGFDAVFGNILGEVELRFLLSFGGPLHFLLDAGLVDGFVESAEHAAQFGGDFVDR